MATLSKAEYWDKVYGCWLGKNCGGTLGAPLERAYAEEEPFNIDWYPELREGGIPNDDLELQLLWLKAVEERGFAIGARDLAQYWLDYVGYNWDEYGLHKTNLRLGLEPPVSGYYNNWFKDCMGSPIRSEIWACLTPGAPAIAARYAYEDAIVDHAGGESVWGEMFNAALQSAAFVERDPQTLLDIALSYIAADSLTARAVRAAREAHRTGLDWRAARERVRAAAPHYVAQYSPTNIGFQVLGWLYGADFGDAICLTVNCGYDTDCTGATVGALLGIIAGRGGLPERWTAPLGDAISTNESWGGLRNASTGPNPVPMNLAELTDRTCALGERLLGLRAAALQIGDSTDLGDLEESAMYAPTAAPIAGTNPLRIEHALTNLTVAVAYNGSPVVAPSAPARVDVQLRNPHPDALQVEVALSGPAGWAVAPEGVQTIEVPAGGTSALTYSLGANDPAHIENSNRALLLVAPSSRPAEPAIPIVLVGARRLQVWGPRPQDAARAGELLDQAFPPEEGTGGAEGQGDWHIVPAPDNALPLPADWTGVAYVRLFLYCPRAQEARIGIPATSPRKVWLNGSLLHEVREGSLLRPNYDGDKHSYADTTLEQGWNTVLVKYVRDADLPPFAAHLVLTGPGLHPGLYDVEWTRLPSERGA